ncbi:MULTISPECIES: mechanosensitive ion channel family protein [unclassified Pseudoalteromonas]|uniref:mechanosensitive ion channel family protein n=1 Tax=unclassified Pseudoalteromonas TaxID=194690 RepID=UPI001408733E|nr:MULTISPECIES: mechanosensitive ion channel domain-containing protein [unclassified Pseudoalteromonas]MBH0025420.1 mechanosensitive ion channel [Pseudoalteromonas sp. SWN29]MBH0038933.1 mechanosensitive ion channel [Pseudoalteromonas sp. SWN166]
MDSVLNWLNDNSGLILHYGIQAAIALVIFLIGSRVAKFCSNLTEKGFAKKKVDKAVGSFVASIVFTLVFAVTILMALSQIGIETTSFIAILGAAGLAVGLALQGSLSNFASGVLIILLRPFKSGDFVEAGNKMGTVKKIEIFSTELRTPDNKVIIVPNSQIMSGAITNFSRESTRRIDLVIGVGYDADLRQAKEVLKSVLDAETRILKDPAYTVAVNELGDSSVNFVVRPWVNAADYWPTYWSLMENIKIALDEANIAIPFPQMDVHFHKQD